MNSIKAPARQILVRTCPMPVYWALWYARIGRLNQAKSPTPLRDVDSQGVDLLSDSAEAYAREVVPSLPREDWPLPFRQNPSFETPDSETYFAMIKRFRPKRIIEIGVGYSSHIAVQALQQIGGGSLTLIDPDPRCPTPPGVRLLRARVEDVPLDIFSSLQRNDILFIDSSHTAEEATYHCREILPRLSQGVIVHHHDVMFPFVPRHPEEAVILDHYTRRSDEYRVLFGLAFLWKETALQPHFPGQRIEKVRIPSSMWVEKVRMNGS